MTFLVGSIIGFVVGVPAGYKMRQLYTRQLWRLSRSIRDKAKGL